MPISPVFPSSLQVWSFYNSFWMQGQLQGIFFFSSYQTNKYLGPLCTFLHQWYKYWPRSHLFHQHSLEVSLDLSLDVFDTFLLYPSEVVTILPLHLNPIPRVGSCIRKTSGRHGITQNATCVNNSSPLSLSVLPKLVCEEGCSGPVLWGLAVRTSATGPSPCCEATSSYCIAAGI